MKYLLVSILAVATFELVASNEDVDKISKECEEEYFDSNLHDDLADDYQYYCWYKCTTDKLGLTDEHGHFNVTVLGQYQEPEREITPEEEKKIRECEKNPKYRSRCDDNLCRQILLTATCIDGVLRGDA